MKKFALFAVGLLGALCALSAAVWITLNCRPLYVRDIDALSIEQTSRMPREEILENYDVLIEYNNIWGPDELEFPTLAMSDGGRQHFAEVKDIFVMFQYAALVTAPLFIAAAILCARRGEYRHLTCAGVIGMIIPVTVGGFAILAWDKLFVLYHELMFDNDFWIFDAQTDPVITMLPDEYFMHCAFLIGGITIAVSAVFIICGRILKCTGRKVDKNPK